MTPSVREAADRLYRSLPTREDQDRGSVSVRTDDIRTVTAALYEQEDPEG